MTVRVLVVDDATFIRDMVKKHLRENIPDIEVLDASDGNKALTLFKTQGIDMVLSDWEMPNLSGEELLRALRKLPHGLKTPFIMVSSRGDRNHVIKAVEAGVSDYLTKPFTPDELLRKVFKQLKIINKLPSPTVNRQAKTQGVAFASVDVLTGGRAAITHAPAPAQTDAALEQKSLTQKNKAMKGKAQLRFANNSIPCMCVVRELSLQTLGGLIQRSGNLPTVFDQTVVDIELEEGGDVARLNGYVHSIQAGENRAETTVVKIVINFVDNDTEKFEVLSRFIAQI